MSQRRLQPPGAPSPAQENLRSANSPVGTSATTASATGRVRWETTTAGSRQGARNGYQLNAGRVIFGEDSTRAHKAPPPHQNGMGENAYNAACYSPTQLCSTLCGERNSTHPPWPLVKQTVGCWYGTLVPKGGYFLLGDMASRASECVVVPG
jgi:hypothetical protein